MDTTNHGVISTRNLVNLGYVYFAESTLKNILVNLLCLVHGKWMAKLKSIFVQANRHVIKGGNWLS